MNRSVTISLAVALFLVGGALLAFGEGRALSTTGTLLGLVAVGLAGWAWLRPPRNK